MLFQICSSSSFSYSSCPAEVTRAPLNIYNFKFAFISLCLHTYVFLFFLSSTAFLPQAGEAFIQPDASDCSCKGSHKEQQSLSCALGVPIWGWSPAFNACAYGGRGLGVWVVGDMTATAQGGGLCDIQWQHKDRRPPGLICGMNIWPCSLPGRAAEQILSPRLLLQHSVHVEQSITSMCTCVCVGVCKHLFVS